MRGVQLAILVLTASAASYGWAASPEAFLGAPPIKASGPGGGKVPEAVTAPSASPSHFGKALQRLQPERRAVTRGAKEVRVYQAAAPAVVLVVSDDGFGSGALIGPDGLIVTNLHVVGDADEVGVVFKPAQGVEIDRADVRIAKVVRRDALTDLALIRAPEVPAGVQPLVLGEASAVAVGADVHAIGHPTGESWTYTRGIVSQVRPGYAWSAEGDKQRHKATVIQTQTPINPGNSGGPLLDDDLKLVGVNSFKGEGEGMNYAVSADDVRALLEMKTDRLAQPAKRNAAAKTCEMEVVATERMDDPVGYWSEIDINCDDKADVFLITPDSKDEPLRMLFDDDEDGELDSVYFDHGQDDRWDYALFDTDRDGKPDLKGYFREGEDEPYRYEKYKPET